MIERICGYPDCWKRRHGYSIFCFKHYSSRISLKEYNEIIQKEYWDNAPNSRHAIKEKLSQ